MKTRPLGSKGPEFSVIGYGAWEASEHWGPFEEDQVITAIHAGIDAGINWIDTAEVYGPHTSEKIVGRAIAGRDVMVATKVAPKPAGTGFKPDEIRKACEASLARLGRDVIDLYQLHWPDERVPLEDTWEAMASLVDEGLVRCIGVSNHDEAHIERCEKVRHVDSLQPHVSMLHTSNVDLVRWCGERGVGVVAYSPLACGLLTGTITSGTQFDPNDWRSGERGFSMYEELFGSKSLPDHLATVDKLRPVAQRLGISMADLAIAWVLHQPGITAAIVGSRNPKHVVANTTALDVLLDERTLAEIAGIVTE